jgi:uncharacterized lipoprotein
MAYAREENDKLEVSYPLEKIWEAIPKAIDMLEWKILETDHSKHYFKIKTRAGFLAYPSTMKVDLEVIDEKNTKLTVAVETPVTTITSIADYGRSRERIEQFIVMLAKLMEGPKAKP